VGRVVAGSLFVAFIAESVPFAWCMCLAVVGIMRGGGCSWSNKPYMHRVANGMVVSVLAACSGAVAWL